MSIPFIQLVKNEVGKKLVYKTAYADIRTSSRVTVLDVNGAGFFLGFLIVLFGSKTDKYTEVYITGDGETTTVSENTDGSPSGIRYVAGSSAASGLVGLYPEDSPGAVGYLIIPFKNNLKVEVETDHGDAEFFCSYALFQ